jgi:anaerobic selenocysteine-containing dehydrogenase
VTRLRGNPYHPVSQGRLCPKGQAALEIVDAPERVRTPLLRAGPRGSGRWKPISWREALDRIAERLATNREAGRPQTNALYHSHGDLVNAVNGALLTPRFANICSLTLWSGEAFGRSDVGVGLRLTGYFGRDSIVTVGERAQTLLVWAHDPATSMTSAIPWLVKLKQRGGKLIVVDSRITQTALLADLHLQPRPGTDLALAGAMAHVLIEHGWIDETFIADHTRGFEAYRAAIASCTPERVETLTGIPRDRIVEAARQYGCCRPAAIELSRSTLGKQADGWQTVRAIASLVGLCGYAGQAGGGLLWAGNLGLNLSLLAAERRTAAPYSLNHYSDIITSLEHGQIDCLLVWGANPLSQWPNLPRARRALDRVGLIVIWDLFRTHTAEEVGDLILPATCWLEEMGLKSGATHVYLMPQVLEPLAECRPAFWIQDQIARRLGIADFFPWPNMAALLDQALDSPDCRGLTVDQLAHSPGGLTPPGRPSLPYADGRYDTPDGRFAFASREASQLGLSSLPPFEQQLADLERQQLGLYPLRLLSCRRSHQFHSFYHSNQGNRRLERFEPEPTLHIHPRDSLIRGVEDGAWAVIFNERGKARVRVQWTTEVPEGSLALSDGWPELNEVTGDSTSLPPRVARRLGMGGVPTYQDTYVEVRPA